MKRLFSIGTALTLFAGTAFGAGYQLNLQGLRQLGMGGSGTAWPWDASTIFYNPGGLARLDGIQASVSGLMIIPTVQFAQASTGNVYTTQSQQFYPFNVYVGGPVAKGSKLAVGVGVYTPFGSGLTWDNNWAGKYFIQSIYLQSIFIQPTASYRINDIISVGAGFIYAFGNLEVKQALPVSNENGVDGQADLKGNANGTGYNLGVQLKASDKLQFGLTYRSQVNMKVKSGNANFNVPPTVASLFPSTNFSSQLPLPQVASIGVGYKPIKKLTLQLDVNFIGWSAYDSLKFDFSKQTADLKNQHAPRLYQNTVAFRLGGNYDFSKKFSAMAGAAYDPTPVHDGFVSPELPDADRIVLTCGVAYSPIRKLTVMAALEYTTTAKRNSTYNDGPLSLNGQYQTKALTPGLGINYNF
ncbi:MAG: outer membrane protein transport protein [Flavipsychrobacter sp.]|nr:outer membrane protein transport protein [Flavipsychrobacter sp.]